MFKIVFTRRAERDLEAVPVRDRPRLAKQIDSLAENPRPHSAKKLEGEDNLYRLRVSDYRVIYTIERRIVTITVVRVGHHRDIYR